MHNCTSCKGGEIYDVEATCKVVMTATEDTFTDESIGTRRTWYLCDDHFAMYSDDGWDIRVIQTF